MTRPFLHATTNLACMSIVHDAYVSNHFSVIIYYIQLQATNCKRGNGAAMVGDHFECICDFFFCWLLEKNPLPKLPPLTIPVSGSCPARVLSSQHHHQKQLQNSPYHRYGFTGLGSFEIFLVESLLTVVE